MSSHKEILRQISELTETLGQVFAEEYRGAAAEVQTRADELAAELAKVRAGEEEALSARQTLEHELETAEKRIETLVQKLKDARQAAAEAAEEAQRALRRQLEALQEECDDARAELEQERSVRKRLEKGAAADEKRLRELEKELDEKGRAAPSVDAGKPLAVAADAGLRDERDQALAGRDEALAALEEERQARACSEDELTQAHKLIEGLEKALKQSQEASRAPAGASDAELRRLADQLRTAEARLEQEQRDGQRRTEACAAAERRVAELEELLHAREPAPASPSGVAAPGRKPAGEAPLPHELRPAPKPGALFRPDWDLAGLPCKSPEQVLQAWASVFNVQLSLEGYPSQYCAAFLVVLKVGKQKQLFVVFNLKASKHVLVCVPSKPPADEAALGKVIEEGRKYLLMSGFELEKVEVADVERVLGTYLGAG